MRYFKQLKDNKLVAIGTGNAGTEITKEEYETLFAEIREKASLVDKLYHEEITLSDVPTEWQDEIQRRVNERIEAEAMIETEATEEDYQNALKEMGVELNE